MNLLDYVTRHRCNPLNQKAITSIWRLTTDAWFDLWAAWDGFWVQKKLICVFPHIRFEDLRTNSTLSEWSVVRRQFQGVVAEPVPHDIFNEILEIIPQQIRERHELEREPIADLGTFWQFETEEQFEDEVIVKLLSDWGFAYQRQVSYKCYFGTQSIKGHANFIVKDSTNEITLFESKLRITNEKQLTEAINQAKSYPLMRGLSSFVVGSPESLRLTAWMVSIRDHLTQIGLGYDEWAWFPLLSQENRHEGFWLTRCGDFCRLDGIGPY